MNEKSDEKIKVIYFMGSGRSGSTLLNIVMGSHPDIFGAGEINNIPRLPQEKFNCSCGERVANCEFWSGVFKDWRSNIGEAAYEGMMHKINKIENFKSLWAWLNALWKYPLRKAYLNDYLNNTYHFLQTISKHSEKSTVIDISKNPLRALLLSYHPKIDLRVIHLVRDGRGVSWSLKIDKQQRPVWRTALFWVIVNRQSNLVRSKTKYSRLIRYEDFVKSSESTLKDISEITSLNMQPVIDQINSEIPLKDSHIMAGNRLRKEKKITIKLDTRWKSEMDNEKRKSITRIARRTLKSYGYLTK